MFNVQFITKIFMCLLQSTHLTSSFRNMKHVNDLFLNYVNLLLVSDVCDFSSIAPMGSIFKCIKHFCVLGNNSWIMDMLDFIYAIYIIGNLCLLHIGMRMHSTITHSNNEVICMKLHGLQQPGQEVTVAVTVYWACRRIETGTNNVTRHAGRY